MKIKILLFVLGLLLLFNYPAYSQKEFLPGYVVLNNGDTLYGTLQDRDIRKGKLYKKIRIKVNQKKLKKYNAYDIKAYNIEGVSFESKWFYDESEFFKFKYHCQYGMGEKLFLRVLEKGNLSLYMIEYVESDNNYFDGFELFFRQGDNYYQRATQGILGLKKKRLKEYFIDCPNLVEKIIGEEIKQPLQVLDFYNNYCK